MSVVPHDKSCLRQTDESHRRGLRTIAAVEFIKGIVVLVVVVGLIALLERNFDLVNLAQDMLYLFHIDPDRRFSQRFLDAAGRVQDANLMMVAAGACSYASVRFIEAYGLWNKKVWAEWFALLSGLVYLPFEIHELLRHATGFKWFVLISNIVIVGYVAFIRYRGRCRVPEMAGETVQEPPSVTTR